MSNDPYRQPGGSGGVDDLQFDRAESSPPQQPAGVGEPVPAGTQSPVPPPGVTACAACGEPITDVYFESNGKVVCPKCRDAVLAAQSAGSPAARFFRAALFGIGAGAVGAAIWYGITVASSGRIFGIVAIVVGLMVGAAVRAGSNRKGGIGYQLLAMAVTYASIAAALAGYAVRELREKGTDVTASPAGIVVFAVIAVSAPVIIGFSSPLTLIIIGIALWEAWRLNKPGQLRFNGPYRIANAPGGAPPPMPRA